MRTIRADQPTAFTVLKRDQAMSRTVYLNGEWLPEEAARVSIFAVGIVRLNRPERLNAWTGAVRGDVRAARHSFDD